MNISKSNFQSDAPSIINGESKFITVNEAIHLTRLSRTCLYDLRKQNKIKWYNPVGRKVLILRSSLLGFIEKSGSSF